jgi:hypothetical protein
MGECRKLSVDETKHDRNGSCREASLPWSARRLQALGRDFLTKAMTTIATPHATRSQCKKGTPTCMMISVPATKTISGPQIRKLLGKRRKRMSDPSPGFKLLQSAKIETVTVGPKSRRGAIEPCRRFNNGQFRTVIRVSSARKRCATATKGLTVIQIASLLY